MPPNKGCDEAFGGMVAMHEHAALCVIVPLSSTCADEGAEYSLDSLFLRS
jgi:hypothetical protein